MTTVNKDFKIKSGLIVEGTTATVNSYDVLTKKQTDQDYIVNLIGGTATSLNTPDTVVKRDTNGDFSAGTITADLNGNVTGTVSDISNHTTADLAEDVAGPLYFTDQRALNATASAYDAAGSATTAETNSNSYTDSQIGTLDIGNTVVMQINSAASTAENNAKSYADSLSVNYDAAGAAATAELNANGYTDTAISTEVISRNNAIDTAVSGVNSTINALTTDDIEEGINNLYFQNSRAKSVAAALLANATKTNITITADVNDDLTIVAENGVADSTTDDLTEGLNNLYFTDARAVSALEAVTPNFTEIDINSVAKQVAATLSAPTAGVQTAYSWASVNYRSAEFLVKVAYGTHTEISKVMLTLDTSDNIAITEYAIVGTNGSASSISAGIVGSNVELQVTTSNNNSTVTVVGTLLA